MSQIELFLFQTDPAIVAEASAAGIDGFVVDWEIRGKERRQQGEGTQINHDTVDDLARVRAATSRRVICRINGFGRWTPREVEDAIEAGADEVLLPMVRHPRDVDAVLALAKDRCGVGILVETVAGVAHARELSLRALSRIYVGLNDLRIDRGSSELFRPLVDGTVEHVRECAGDIPFGVAGLTLPDHGDPVPSRLLAAELTRLQADFTFLRRSFLADTAGGRLTAGARKLRAHLDDIAYRTGDRIAADRHELVRTLAIPEVLPA